MSAGRPSKFKEDFTIVPSWHCIVTVELIVIGFTNVRQLHLNLASPWQSRYSFRLCKIVLNVFENLGPRRN